MVTNEHFCGIKFAFDLPEDHPAHFEGDDLLFNNAYSLHDMDADLEFVGADYLGDGMSAVFAYSGNVQDFADSYDVAIQWLNEIKGEDE